jgi:hypothetical protein
VDTQALMRQEHTLLMEWCISCHKEPEKNLRPKTEVFSMSWKPAQGGKWGHEDFFHGGMVKDKDGHEKLNELVGKDRPTSQSELGDLLKKQYNIRDAITLTNCSMCHR